uniref:U-box domain-containing protein n=1 Tax=Populus davidiana TaxID=266767 RepID=A0A6M2EDM9_9ROSI
MVLMMIQHHHHRHHQHQHQQTSTALPPHPVPLSTSAHRSPATPSHAQSQPPLPLAPLSSSSHRLPPPALDHVISPIASAAHHSADPAPTLARVRLSDISPYDGAPGGPYVRAVDALSGSLMRHNAAVIELGSEEASLMRCGLEAARLYFRSRSQNGVVKGCSGRGVYMYRAGRPVEDWDSSPPCMAEIFRCMGKAARSALCAIARHLRLRSDVFNQLLDDTPLPAGEVSSSVLVATYSHTSLQNGKGAIGAGKPAANGEVEKGLLTLISSDSPGLQVCDPNGRWYLADYGSAPVDLLLITGKTLSHTTAGLRPAASYRAAPDFSSGTNSGGRTSLVFRLMPQGNAILDCSPIAAAGHVIPQSYVPISVSQFMDDLSAEEDVVCNQPNNNYVAQNDTNKEPSLRSVLSDPLSGAFLEDAMFVSCGHSFGGLMLRRVIDMSRCTLCNAEIEAGSLVPNYALRAAASAVKNEDDRRLFHNATLRKRRKEMGDHTDSMKKRPPHGENGDIAADDGLHRGVQYPFAVNEKVVIKVRFSILFPCILFMAVVNGIACMKH